MQRRLFHIILDSAVIPEGVLVFLKARGLFWRRQFTDVVIIFFCGQDGGTSATAVKDSDDSRVKEGVPYPSFS